MKCPFCGAVMFAWDHGRCENCDKYCGCSFMPTSFSDYCDDHRPDPLGDVESYGR